MKEWREEIRGTIWTWHADERTSYLVGKQMGVFTLRKFNRFEWEWEDLGAFGSLELAQAWAQTDASPLAGLLKVAKGMAGYLAALPEDMRPDEQWMEPVYRALERAEGAI